MNASYLDRDHVPADVLEGEKKIMLAQMSEDPKMKNKPEQVLAKIVEGKIGKYVEKCAKELGGTIKVADYVRYERGEGIAKREDNFADEVASMIK